MTDDVMVHPPAQAEAYRKSGEWSGPTLAEEVRRWATERPDALAVVDGSVGREVTYAELWDDVSRLAAWLQDKGIGRGDGVSVQLPSRYETVVVDLAVLTIGARLNPLLPNYRRKELASFLRVSHAKAFVTPGTYRRFDHAELGAELAAEIPELLVHLVVDDEGPAGHVGLTEALRHDPLSTFPALDPTSVSELIFTSGTESQPKAVMHTEETTNHSARSSYAHLGLGDDDVVWMPSPVGHSTGFNFGVRMALLHGLPVVLQDRWEPDLAAELIEKYRCTYTLAAATFLTDLLRSAREHGRDLSSMRVFGCSCVRRRTWA
jgi:acyl-coenzyme A synthetase/AMP-(fatty) acid ligase